MHALLSCLGKWNQQKHHSCVWGYSSDLYWKPVSQFSWLTLKRETLTTTEVSADAVGDQCPSSYLRKFTSQLWALAACKSSHLWRSSSDLSSSFSSAPLSCSSLLFPFSTFGPSGVAVFSGPFLWLLLSSSPTLHCLLSPLPFLSPPLSWLLVSMYSITPWLRPCLTLEAQESKP